MELRPQVERQWRGRLLNGLGDSVLSQAEHRWQPAGARWNWKTSCAPSSSVYSPPDSPAPGLLPLNKLTEISTNSV